jgi:lipoic acid synthetase
MPPVARGPRCAIHNDAIVKLYSLSNMVLADRPAQFVRRQKPSWLRAKLPGGPNYQRLRDMLDGQELHTVCESAKCPNLGECWQQGTATIMILGDVCTRACGFCHIKTGRPPTLDTDEPNRVARAIARMGWKHIVITSVNRDELPDGGAAIWARTIREIRQQSPATNIEVLIPDFCGDWNSLQVVLDAKPDILNHNMESIRRLYPAVRPQAKYDQSLELLNIAKGQGFITKTGIMVGIGEEDHEVEQLMNDLRQATTQPDGKMCDILTIGQYLQPTADHLPINRWVTPDQFAIFKQQGETLGIGHVESGPLVRSSYHAQEQATQLRQASAPAPNASSN